MQRPEYEALDGNGLPHIREARVVHELPTPEARGDALRSATQSIAQLLQITARRTIPFGAPVFVAFGLTRPQAKAHKLAQLLLTKGEDLSLDHCPQYNAVMSRAPDFVLQADAGTGVTLIAGCSGSVKSMLDRLTPHQQAQMMAWSDGQPPGPGGATDLMAWPGWAHIDIASAPSARQ